ncbi:MAG TPA: hypothetical protein VD735_07765 [Candidatus Saccharimonadales bacterium]|nr:hypothetical protein [Candidatus Saccharimonadales bacterium]
MRQSRAQLFEAVVDDAQAVIDQLDPQAFHPDIASAVEALATINQQVFLPNISSRGIIEIPKRWQDEDGVALVPVLPRDGRTLYLGHTTHHITPTRMAAMGRLSGLSQLRVGLETEAYIANRPNHERVNAVSVRDRKTDAITHTLTSEHTVDGTPLHYRSRPVIFMLAGSNGSPLTRATDAIHEYVHAYDAERDPVAGSYYAEIEQSTQHELRAYHVGRAALLAGKSVLLGEMSSEAAMHDQIEHMRMQHTSDAAPFKPDDTLVDCMLRHNFVNL